MPPHNLSEDDDKGQLSPSYAEAAKQLVDYSDEKLTKLWLINAAFLALARCSASHDKKNSIWERTLRLVKDEAKRRDLKLQGKLN